MQVEKRTTPAVEYRAVKSPAFFDKDGVKTGTFIGVTKNSNLDRRRATDDILLRAAGYDKSGGTSRGLFRDGEILVLAYTRKVSEDAKLPPQSEGETEIYALDIIPSVTYRASMDIHIPGTKTYDKHALVIRYHQDGCREVIKRPNSMTPDEVAAFIVNMPSTIVVGRSVAQKATITDIDNRDVILTVAKSGSVINPLEG